MVETQHIERHFSGNDMIRDIVIGMSDGLTVPFALAAGLSGAVQSTGLILTAGGAEIAAGSIAMGLGGYLAAKSDADHYHSELKREYDEVERFPEKEEEEIRAVFREYALEEEHIEPIVQKLKQSPDKWVDFMMRFELGLEKPNKSRAWISAVTIALSYIVGGIIPLLPYFFVKVPSDGLIASVILTLIILFIFGGLKGKFTGTAIINSGLETMIVGGLAAAAAFLLARSFS
ncbi:VIT1/CCC1 transporter family protein [Bacillus sp. FJAT-49736]|uniref:VIT1/CCC1 transporter family protein n=1 Tax=Bacillus sp. FJAT-49736 TaxID=2833582 RepID=UPI001BC9BB9F|nr:VIT1/CCC1 transporter family protein [Bacillus sp. FJAT-49736]MBS4173024.1 VIT1/CCC1 transporter family protein [Bacillus sp. FJAT-49736]